MRAAAKLTEVVDGEPRSLRDPPVTSPIEDVLGVEVSELEEFVRRVMRSYRQTLSPTVGTCSGTTTSSTRLGRWSASAASAPAPGSRCCWAVTTATRCSYSSRKQRHLYSSPSFQGHVNNHGRRVVEGQRLTQAASDILLGWLRRRHFDGVTRDFFMRQLWDKKASARWS